jgi:hypothetical protein
MVHEHKRLNVYENRRRRGQGMLEFALALPVFLMLVLGVIEFGRLLAVVSSVTTAAREGARYGSAAGLNDGSPMVPYYNDCQGMRDAARRVGFFAGIQDANIAIGYFDADSRSVVPDPTGYAATNQCTGTTSTYSYDPARGPRVVMKVSVPFKFLFLSLPAFPISSQSARTIVTQVDMDVTPGEITPAPPKTATPTPSGTWFTPTLTASLTETPTPSETPTITGTLPTATATPTETLTPTTTNTPTVTITPTPLPPCGFVSVGSWFSSGTNQFGFYVYNSSGVSSNPYPPEDIWIRSIMVEWISTAKNEGKYVTLNNIKFGVAYYTAPGGGDTSPVNVGFGSTAGPHLGPSSNGPLEFYFNVDPGTSVSITAASVVIEHPDSNGDVVDCTYPPNPFKPR